MGTTTYYSIGLMSGTSLDGVDLAYCRFDIDNTGWHYDILEAETISYDPAWTKKLIDAPHISGRELLWLHFAYGKYLGKLIRQFIGHYKIEEPGIISSHGHTVFHDPASSYTFQLGHGAAIAAETKLDVVADFRSLDVALGGQGAPLVPAGDSILFGKYAGCINLGGFVNISFKRQEVVHAFDICPLNFVINRLVQKAHIKHPHNSPKVLMYDLDGHLGRQGQVHDDLLQKLNSLAYYAHSGAKSLGEEWVEAHLYPLLSQCPINLYDSLRTLYEHATEQIIRTLRAVPAGEILISGGGAYNNFLLELLSEKISVSHRIIIPDKKIIEYKEALIFALLGVLRMTGNTNCLASVTGSRSDSCGGSILRGTL